MNDGGMKHNAYLTTDPGARNTDVASMLLIGHRGQILMGADGTLFLSSEYQIRAIDPEGTVIWTKPLAGPNFEPMV